MKRLLNWFKRRMQRCDGCSRRYGINRLNAASSDTWLCNTCIQSVMLFGKYPHELSMTETAILAVSMEDE